MKKLRRLFFCVTLFMGSCATAEGVGFGSGEDDYKKSPCACAEIEQKWKRFYKG